jgi:hypothetical protein
MLLAKKLWAIIYIIVCLVLTMFSMVAAQAATPTSPSVDFQDPSDIQAVVELEDGYTEANLYEKLDPLTKAENFEIASSGFPVTRPNPSNLTIVDIPEDRVFDRIEDLEKLPGVKSAQLNIPYFPATYTPDDAAFGSQWYLDDTNPANIGAQAAWTEVGSILNGSPVTCSESTPVCGGDENVVVAVIDTGVNQNITEFTGVNFVNPAAFEYKVNPCSGGEVDVLGKQTSLGYMCKLPTQNDDCVTSSGSTLSSCGHGTQVASVIAMQDNASDGIGIAYNVSIMPISIKGAFNTIGVAKAIEHAKDNGADVINMSLAAIANDPTVETEINEAYNAGVTIVAASGNCGNSFIGGSGCFPSVTPSSPWYNYGGTNPVIYPAYYDNVISVGALEGNNTRSLYSTYNSRLDISAPVGSGVYTIYRDGTPVQTTTTIDGKSVNGIGTSFAAPQVAAAAALVKSIDPSIHVEGIKQKLYDSATDVGVTNRDNETGFGRLNIVQSIDTIYWTPWTTDFQGSFITEIDTEVFDNKLYQVHRGQDNRIYTRFRDSGNPNWTSWQEFGGSTTRYITMVSFNGKLYQYHIGNDQELYSRETSDGTSWSVWSSDKIGTFSVPITVVVYDSTLYQYHIGMNRELYSRSSIDGINWTNWTTDFQGTFDTPVMAAVFNNKLYQNHIGLNNELYIREFNEISGTWSGWSTDFKGTFTTPVTMIEFDNRFYQAHRGQDRRIYTRSRSVSGNWGDWRQFGGSTNHFIELVNFESKLSQYVIGLDRELYNREYTT